MMSKAVKLVVDTDMNIELPVITAQCGADVVDIASLAQANLFTFDQGFANTASCESKITYIDGEKGILRYRGYPIEELSQKSNYLETCYLIFFGELPNTQQYNKFQTDIQEASGLEPIIIKHIKLFKQEHPMATLASITNILAGIHHDKIDIRNPEHRYKTAINLIAKIPLIAAACYRQRYNKPDIELQQHLDYATNFLSLLQDTNQAVNPVFAKALDLLLLLHADHEQNASTSTVRLTGSSGSNPYACIAAGISSLWGPAHGGANEAVLNMLEHINDANEDIDSYIARSKDKNDSFRLMGFGHRVYKNFDPRAKIVRDMCHKVLEHAPGDNKIFRIARELEQKALADKYFIDKKLYPNVDFYTGIIMHAIGIPTNMFTVMFAIGRTVGWISHWNEMLSSEYRIGRPRQLYTGHNKRSYPG